jgi:RNA polymerase sigma-70 factor (ECF subfamily)
MVHPGDRDRWSDSQLLAAVAERDGEAFRAFYRRHLASILRYLMRETRDREAAADLAAEVFAAVMLSAQRYRPLDDTARSWVIGIARNTLGASRRRGRVEDRARRRIGLEPLDLDDSDLERLASLAAGDGGPISELVDALPEAERQAVKSRVLEDQSYAQIAAELRCSEQVVRKRVSRGLARVREQLKEN